MIAVLLRVLRAITQDNRCPWHTIGWWPLRQRCTLPRGHSTPHALRQPGFDVHWVGDKP